MKKGKKKKNSKFAASMFGVMLLGIALFVFGIKNSIELNEKSKDYVSVEGRLCGYSLYDSDGESYSLEYEYIVNGIKYYISTNYGVGVC